MLRRGLRWDLVQGGAESGPRWGDTLGGWAACALGEQSDLWGQQRSQGLCHGWGAAGGTPRVGVPMIRLPGWVDSAPPPLPLIPSPCPPHCATCPLCSMGTLGCAAAPVPAHGLGKLR